MNVLSLNLNYLLGFFLPNIFRTIEICFFVILMAYFFSRIKIRRKDEDPYFFELFIGLFFLFSFIGTTWELICVAIDPIFLHPGLYYFHELILLPTGFTGEALIQFFGFIALGFLSVGAEKGSNLPTKGIISLIPFSIASSLLLFGMLATTMPWFGFAFAALMIPALFFYIALKADGGVRNKALFMAFGFLFIFACKSMTISLWTRNFPELVSFFLDVVLRHPVDYALPLFSIIGCILIVISQVKYSD